jgi:hypothetical protein
LYRHVWKASKDDESNHFPGAVHLEHENAKENNKGEKNKSKRNKGEEKGKTISNGKALIASVDGHPVGISSFRHQEFGNIFLQGIEGVAKRATSIRSARLTLQLWRDEHRFMVRCLQLAPTPNESNPFFFTF